VLRHRELMKAIAPSAATEGALSGPGPVVNRTGAPPAVGSDHRLVAPPRFDE
jgi:hypothetical protein